MPDDSPTAQSSAQSRWRREAVAPLLTAYAGHPGVEAVLLSGSVARGDADRWSDVEIGVSWSTPPSDAGRRELATAGGVDSCRLFPYDEAEEVWCDDLHLGAPTPDGLLVEVVHIRTASLERVLTLVLDEYSPDPTALNAVQAIVDGVPVHGDALVAGWQARVADYPRGLAVAVVESAGVIDHFWRWEMLVARHNPVMLAGMFSAVSERVLSILLALNRRYGPKPKWFDQIAASLLLAPPNLADRLRTVFVLEPAAAAAALAELVEETFTLVETELPEVDVERLRAIFRNRRRPLDALPTGYGRGT